MLHRRLIAGAFILLLVPLAACSRSSASRAVATDASRGATIFAQQCSACHGAAGVGGPIGPALRGKHLRAHAVRLAIERPQPPMPKLFPGQLSAEDLADVTAYVSNL